MALTALFRVSRLFRRGRKKPQEASPDSAAVYLRSRAEKQRRSLSALQSAAAASDPPHPTAWIKLPLEEPMEVHFHAGSRADSERLADWFSRGRYADLAEEVYLAIRRDAES